MSDELDAKIAHLGFIQGIIGRMSATSLTLKTMAVTLVAAVVALTASQEKGAPWLALAGLFPVAVFWLLDAHYLQLERAYRAMYNDVRAASGPSDFSLDWRRYDGSIAHLLVVALSRSIVWLYLAAAAILLAVWFITNSK